MTNRRNALGRGLEALIPSTPSEGIHGHSAAGAPETAAGFSEIPIDSIDPNPEQPRRVFDPEQIEQLAASLRRHGVLQPVVVRRSGERFELIVGERRWRAARRAGLATLPAVVSDVDPRERLELALVENVQRRDLNPIELAHAFRALSQSGYTQEQIGDQVGLDRSSVANHVRLLDLPRELQEDVESGRVSMGHAKALLQVANPERRRLLRNQIVAGSLTVREAESRARAISGPSAPRRPRRTASPVDPDLQRLADELRDRLQTRVRLVGNPERGSIQIEYFGAEELHRIALMLLDRAASSIG